MSATIIDVKIKETHEQLLDVSESSWLVSIPALDKINAQGYAFEIV